MSSLRALALSRPQFASVAVLSVLATAAIIATGGGRTAAQSAAVAALAHRPVVVRLATVAAASATQAASAPDTSGFAPAPAASSPAPAASSPAPAASSPAPASSAAGSGTTAGGGTPSPAATTPRQPATRANPRAHPARRAGHVFVIALTAPSYDAAFGPASAARYLNGTLRPKGTLLERYTSLSSAELPDYLAMVSGQAPNADTEQNCPAYAEFPAKAKPASDGQVPRHGCVYPNAAITVADQVTAAGKSWSAYVDGLDPESCVHPNSDAADDAPLPGAQAQYDDRHNPFIYFHSLLDLGGCASNDVALDKLAAALRSKATTPAYSFIAPGACQDAAATSCPGGAPAGLAGEDAFLRQWVPKILSSPAYRTGGVVMIVAAPSGRQTGTTGGHPSGALVLSPYAARGRTIATRYDAYSVLHTTEELLGLSPLGRARDAPTFLKRALPRM